MREFKDERRYHVEKVLDRVFPSAEKEERKLKHMVNQQDYLYEGYIDTEVVPEEDQNGSYLNADIPNRQFTQITEEGTLGDREEMEKEATDNLMRQTFGDGRLE